MRSVLILITTYYFFTYYFLQLRLQFSKTLSSKISLLFFGVYFYTSLGVPWGGGVHNGVGNKNNVFFDKAGFRLILDVGK